jgi:hypothetical protein
MKQANLTDRVESAKREFKLFSTLMKHFVVRLFNNDILKFENQKRESLVVLLTILAVSGGVISTVLLLPYLSGKLGYTFDTAWMEKSFFITLSMAFTGIISVINWDNMYLDEKDYLYLSGLPVNTSTMYAAKFFSLLVFVGIISLAFNLFSLLVFMSYLGKIVNLHPFYDTGVLTFGLIHLMSSFIANLFTFMTVALVQLFLMLLLKGRWLKRISMIAQAFLLMGFISVFAWFPRVYSLTAQFKGDASSFMYYFPPMWFVGFYEQMVGNYDFIFKPLYYIAGIAVVLLCDLYLAGIPLSLRRFSNASVVSGSASKLRKKAVELKEQFDSRFLENPLEKAIFYFSLAALSRSRRHRLQLVVSLTLPLAFIATELTVLALTKGWIYFKETGFFLVAIPSVFYVFLVVGFRMAVLHPIAEEANWIFRITELSSPIFYLRGLKKAFFMIGILPLFFVLFLFYYSCWGFLPALYHSLFAVGAALLLVEGFFIDYSKMPFASGYVPGKANIKAFWFLYTAGFAGFVYLFSKVGILLLKNPLYYMFYYSAVAVLLWLARRYRYRKLKEFRFVFDEEPEPAMLGLGLDV